MTRLLLFLLPLTLTAQSKITLMADSSVTGIDYNDVKRWATNRVAQNLATHSAVLEIGALNGQVQTLRKIADTERTSKEAMRAAWTQCETERADLLIDRDRWKTKAKGRGRNTPLWMAAALVAGIMIAQ